MYKYVFKHLNENNIKFVMATPHTHSAGRDVHTRLIRNNKDVGYVFHNKYYSYNSQNQYLIDPPITLKKVNIFYFNKYL